MITSEREDFLTAQYIWTMQSDGEWHWRAKAAIEARKFSTFRRHCGEWIGRIRADISDRGFTEPERAYVVLTLWRELGGEEDLTNGDFAYYQFLLKPTNRLPDHERLQQEIQQHKEKAAARLAQVAEELNRITQETHMSQIAFQTKSYVYGTDVACMNEQELIDAIKSVETEIANLGQVKTASKKIDAKKAELTAMLANIVEILDAK